MAAPDPGYAAMAATMPCMVRRQLGKSAVATIPDYGFFPWKGQNIDTPRGVATKWTTDDDTHPIP
jgi:hypothetical protein